ncbi:MAG: SDR family NAD(P)-dependent oxidoreductase [Caulobacteraceae bacterium]
MGRRLCLVTGASAGIGEAFARLYARNGHDLVLTARRTSRLERLAEELRELHDIDVQIVPVDLAEPGAVDRILAAIEARGHEVDVLVNNAGYGLPGSYADTTWSDQQAFLQVLLIAVCEMTHKLLPGMLSRGYGRILNIASVAGLIPGMPNATLYGATKAFLVRFSQALHVETLGTGVHVTALCPGFTWSEFHDVNGTREETNRIPKWMWLDADTVAEQGWRAVEAGRAVQITGGPNKLIVAICAVVPDAWMLGFVGRKARRFRRP